MWKILQDTFDHREQIASKCAGAFSKYAGWLAIAAILAVGLGSYLLQKPVKVDKVRGITVTSASSSATPTTTPTPAAQILVDVSGAVNSPGVKQLEMGQRVEDAIKQAGGFSPSADPDYIAISINLAAKIEDGQKIFIPAKGQALASTTSNYAGNVQQPISGADSAIGNGAKVNINNASASQLDSLPGIGETYSQRIIAGRPYSSVEDLCSRDDIFRSKSTCDKIRPLISI